MNSTLAKGLDVLEWLARQESGCRVTDVAQQFALVRSNAHRTLQTLVECGWAVQDSVSSTYSPSFKLFELGSLVENSLDLKTRLHPHLAKLAAASGETIHLAALDGAEIIYLDKFDSSLPVATYSRIGGRAPAYCIATGKALLAAIDHDEAALQALLGPLQAHTPNTITRLDSLRAELALTRARGWGENREEWRIGVCGLGVPVFNARGKPVAAVGMSVPTIRFSRMQAKALIDQLRVCARDASETLGYKSNQN